MNETTNLHIVSWNVAGWKTTLSKINASFGSLDNWLSLLDIDILCIQEVKLKKTDIDKTMGADLKDYESFWSCPNVSSLCSDQEKKRIEEKRIQARHGINGCATFVKKSLVVKANSRILEDKDFDDEGRCIMTDHHSFVVFNVYVPFSGHNYERFGSKMMFLELLGKAMDKQRLAGKNVILVGDLNTTSGSVDCAPAYRRINIKKLLAANPNNNDIVQKLQSNWKAIYECLDNITYDNDNDKNKWKLYCNYDGKKHYLGVSDDEPTTSFFFGEVLLCNDDYVIKDSEKTKYHTSTNKIHLTLTKADIDGNIPSASYNCKGKYYCLLQQNYVERSDLEKLWDVVQKQSELKNGKRLYLSAQQWEYLSSSFGAPCHSFSSVHWLNKLLSNKNKENGEGIMIDSFRVTNPVVNFRFTCWDQSTNRRYHNVGNRIDYILVDATMWNEVNTLDNYIPLHNGCIGNENDKYNDNDKALRAATCNGKFKEVTAESKGLQATDVDAIQMHARYQKHTGMIYTPPEWSDHIAVSLLIKKPVGCNQLLLSSDSATSLTQPHKKQTSITSFFTAPAKKQKLG